MLGAQEVQLLGTWASPYAVRPRIALNLKGVPYEYVPQPVGPKRELVHKYNPAFKKIPVLVHNGKPISESMIIVEYIDEVWPSTGPALLPAAAYDRAAARFWTAYFDDKWFDYLKKAAILAAKEGDREEAIDYMVTVLEHLEESFVSCNKGKSSFFGGDTIGYLDIAVGSHLGWLKASEKMTGMELLNDKKTPALLEWAERFCSHPAVNEVMPETEKLIEFAQVLRVKLMANATSEK